MPTETILLIVSLLMTIATPVQDAPSPPAVPAPYAMPGE